MPRRLLILIAALAAAAFLLPGRALAHNSLVSSDPADGSTVPAAPTQLTFVFAADVPLDTMSAEYIDGAGVRNDLANFTHGPSGTKEVVVVLPALPAGEVTVRWRLVGPDGHPITGRVSFTITQGTAPTTLVPTTAPLPAAGTGTTTTTTSPVGGVEVAAPTAPASDVAAGSDDGFGELWRTPDATRWIFRMSSYVAIMAVAGIVATAMFVWRRSWEQQSLRTLAAWAVAVAFGLSVVQLLVVASDIEAKAPWQSLGGVSAALETDAGIAFVVRCVALAALASALFVPTRASASRRWQVAAGCVVAALGTWAYAGHSQSMRWSLVGIPLDVAHHAAAGAWVGGLAIVGLVAMRRTEPDELVGIVRRFGELAKVSVLIIVGTGLLQSLRLVGSPTRLLSADHGQYLLVKVAALAVMLRLADLNRRRVAERFQRPDTATPTAIFDLRRAIGIEMFVGIAIIGITAVMVVSPPAVANEDMTPATSSSVPAATGDQG